MVYGITPCRAVVRPRVQSADASEAVPIEEVVEARLDEDARGALLIVGAHGSGKTTALRHLAAVFESAERLRFLDDTDDTDDSVAAELGEECLVIFTSAIRRDHSPHESLRLAPWSQDEAIEYLLETHPAHCASVMSRLRGAKDSSFLEGNPELWAIVLESMAEREELRGAKEALRRHVVSVLGGKNSWRDTWRYCKTALGIHEYSWRSFLDYLTRESTDETVLRLLRHHPVRLLAVADLVAGDLENRRPCSYLRKTLPRAFVSAIAEVAGSSVEALEQLRHLATVHPKLAAMTASILHAAGARWSPHARGLDLSRAYLTGVDWPGVHLEETQFARADLAGARLDAARLEDGWFAYTNLRSAKLGDADLRRAVFSHARLPGADLRGARLHHAIFMDTNMIRSRLQGASMPSCEFHRVKLDAADVSRANLHGAKFEATTFKGASFVDADLSRATLEGIDLTGTDFSGARFDGANLRRSSLEYVDWPDMSFAGARLDGALLTGSTLRGAKFQRATLRQAALAEVDWEEADLRGANLEGATFHMGSSRTGMLFGKPASHGSRTGFYTDEFTESAFKPAEEIRKANLRGADLLGARIENVDFYLVDLRDANYSPEQEERFRRCGAILDGWSSP